MNGLLTPIMIAISLICVADGVIFRYRGLAKNRWFVYNASKEKIILELFREKFATGRALVTAGN